MPEFLSSAWIASLDRAAQRSAGLAECARARALVLEQRVTMPDGTERAHHLVLRESGARVLAGRADDPDVVLHSDLPTARALALGTLNAQRALADGSLRVGGDVAALVSRAEALGALDDVFATVRAETTFPHLDGATVTSVE